MHESFWGTFVIAVGVIITFIIFTMQRIVNSEQQLNDVLRNTTEAAMLDSIDYDSYYKATGDARIVRIDREAFVENFVRRFSENASLDNTYVIEFYDINEYPPKVSIRVKTKNGLLVGDKEYEFNNSAQIDAIIESLEGGMNL